MTENTGVLCDRTNLVVVFDEAHRSQYCTKSKLKTDTGRYVYGYAKHLRDALPGASFIGFTGTPIDKADANTQAVFGGYVSIYDIEDAKNDKATVPINDESRLAKLDINRDEIAALKEEVEEVIEDEEDFSTREHTKGKGAQLAKLVGAEERLQEVAEDLVEHFQTRKATLEGKRMAGNKERRTPIRRAPGMPMRCGRARSIDGSSASAIRRSPLVDSQFAGDRQDDRDGAGDAGGDETPRGSDRVGPAAGRSPRR